jgi:murein L,D-transpeptidase YcbB/YkuD
MNRGVPFILLLFIVFSCQQKPSSEEISEAIPALLANADLDGNLESAYGSNDHRPIWVKSGGLNNGGEKFLEGLEEIVSDGLAKEDYWREEQQELLEQVKASKDPSLHAQLDIALSKAFLQMASDLNRGKVDPSAMDIEWKMARKEPTANYQELMLDLGGGGSLEKVLEELRPAHDLYANLRKLFQTLKENPLEESGFLAVPEEKIEKGDQHEAIPAVRKKLFLLKDLEQMPDGGSQIYDEQLFEAVKRFQHRHGLIDDGVIGADFIKAINYNHQDLLTKVQVNMERLRWMPDSLDNDRNKVLVNIPDFYLFYVQNEDTVLTSRVVVGQEYRQTPVFQAEMTYLAFSPTWTLPETILWEDAIPAIQKDRSYLAKNNMKVLDYQGNEVNPRKINWGQLKGKEDFPYIIRQAPGSDNPLGKVKFMFPNEHSIYIHDSPAQSLFTRDDRAFSSGCIRMEKPQEFAAMLLEDADWDEEMLAEAMNQPEEKTVNLKEPQQVWLLYLTVWSENGDIEVREDVYSMDRELAEALALPMSDHFL